MSRPNLYIPVPRANAPSASTTKLPAALLRRPADEVFRTVSWSGSKPIKASADSNIIQLDLKVRRVRAVFSSIAWNGAKQSPPTPFQEKQTLRGVFSNFRWEQQNE